MLTMADALNIPTQQSLIDDNIDKAKNVIKNNETLTEWLLIKVIYNLDHDNLWGNFWMF